MATIVAVTGIPAIEKALNQLDGKDRVNTERRAVRAAANVLAKILPGVAASSQVPHSFETAKKISVSTSGGRVHAAVRPKSPLFNIFEGGAGGHEIAPRTSGTYARGRGKNRRAVQETHAGVLAGPGGSGSWDATGRKRPGAFFSSKPVRHPGFHGRPLLPRIAAIGGTAALNAMAAIILGQAPGSTLGAVE